MSLFTFYDFLNLLQNIKSRLAHSSFSQEGLARPSQTKQRIHLSAIAKTALRFSFLRFKARNSTAEPSHENEAASSNDPSNEDTRTTIPNGHTVSNNEDRKGFNLANVTRMSSIPTPKISIEGPSLPDLSGLGLPVDARLVGLEAKIRRIEDQVIEFRHTFNSEMSDILTLLADLKKTESNIKEANIKEANIKETNIKETNSEAGSSGSDIRPVQVESDLSTITTYF